jgi:hypothetical protein
MVTYKLLHAEKQACSGPCFLCGVAGVPYYHIKQIEPPGKGRIRLTRDCCEECARALGLVW